MGYRAAKYPDYPLKWRVIYRVYKKDPKTGEYVAKQRHVPESEYPQIGITKAMSLEEVKAALKKKNLDDRTSQREEKRNAIASRMATEADQVCAHLPTPFVRKFEAEHLATRYIGNVERLTKVLKLWRAAQRIIRTLKIPTEKWHRYPEHFYAHFEKHAASPGYAKNILSTVNMWLDFLGLEQDKHYRPIPAPNAVWQSRINTAFEEGEGSRASLPITPEQLDAAHGKNPLPSGEAQYNWLYCSVWAGLRPNEVNSLTNKKRTRIVDQDGTPILMVYQSKLKNVPKTEDRWKRIPLFLPEQLKIIEILESGLLEEPLCKVLAGRFGAGHTLYAGRKGFHDLMVTRFGQPELEVVRWLGHRSLDMAMKHYAKKDAVRWTPRLKKAG